MFSWSNFSEFFVCMIYKNVLETIGNTPLVEIVNFKNDKKVKILAKLEGTNPGGSIKDRVALRMIKEAEEKGSLNKEKIIIEPTSGNTGIALSMIGAVKGYKVIVVMSEAVSPERRKMIKAFGADIILTDGNKGTDGAIQKCREIVESAPDDYYMPDQFSNRCNYLAHYENTGREIWEQTGGKIDYFVSALGTSGTLMGVGSYLKKKNPKIKIVSAEPTEGHYIQGLKNMKEAIVPKIYDKAKIDETIPVESEEAFEAARKITVNQGIFVGMSSGAAMLACSKLAQKIKTGTIVSIFPDKGDKYLSTRLFQ